MKNKLLLFAGLSIVACKAHPDANRQYDNNDPKKVYKLRLNPAAGSQYHYDISNESELKLEVMSKKIDNLSQSTLGVIYLIDKDSTGDLLLSMVYEKLHVHNKNGDNETDMDTEQHGESADVINELIKALKNDTIIAVLSPSGETKSIRGYEEMKAKLLEKVMPSVRSTAEKQFDQRIKDGLIKKNMEQFLNIFPDSAVHIGDRWKISSTQLDQLKLHIITSYQLTEIRDNVAVITSHGEVAGDNSTGNMNGYDYTADLKGQQEGKFEIEMATGMLLNGNMTSDIEGQMSMMGRQVPVNLHTSLKMEGRKLK